MCGAVPKKVSESASRQDGNYDICFAVREIGQPYTTAAICEFKLWRRNNALFRSYITTLGFCWIYFYSDEVTIKHMNEYKSYVKYFFKYANAPERLCSNIR